MSVLAIGEYERIACGEKFDAQRRTITAAQHSILERVVEEYKRRFNVTILQHGPRRSLVAQNFVGVINMGRDQLEVLPKIDASTHVVRANLLQMISLVMSLDLHVVGASKMAKTEDSILEVLIGLYCAQLWHAIRRGMIKRYQGHRENLNVLRGRLVMSVHLRLNLARPDRLMCDYDEFTENNQINQILKAALLVLERVSRSQVNRRNLIELLFCFQDVDDVSLTEIRWDSASIDRLNARYAPLISMARVFIEGSSPDVVSGAGDGFALLFDMNELFESYVARICQRVFGGSGRKVSLQGPKKHLARLENGAAAFGLKPDIVVHDGSSVSFIVDTKWKRLTLGATREGVASSDAYQLFAYSTKYAAHDVVLLYPHHPGLGEWKARRASYIIDALDAQKNLTVPAICVTTVDLRDLSTVPAQLQKIFPHVAVEADTRPVGITS